MVDWAAVGAVATGTAAMTTAITAGLIAWQAKETRNAANAARGSVEVGRSSLKLSQALAIESIKTRLDLRAPKLTVLAAPAGEERARHKAQRDSQDLGTPWPWDREFRRSEDDYTYLSMGAEFSIQNEGGETVRVTVSGPVSWLDPKVGQDGVDRISDNAIVVDLPPAARCQFRLEETRPLCEWANAWQRREKGEVGDNMAISGGIGCSDAYDDGTISIWDLQVYAYPVEPKPRDLAAWLLRPVPGSPSDPAIVTAVVHPQRRHYYISKTENRPLLDLDD